MIDIILMILLLTPIWWLVLIYKAIKKQKITILNIVAILVGMLLPYGTPDGLKGTPFQKVDLVSTIVLVDNSKPAIDFEGRNSNINNPDGSGGSGDLAGLGGGVGKLDPSAITKINEMKGTYADAYKEWMTILRAAAKKHNVPVWTIAGLNLFENRTYTLKPVLLGGGCFPFEKYGQVGKNGKVINYMNYGQPMSDGFNCGGSPTPSPGAIIGPFQLQIGKSWIQGQMEDGNGDGIQDPYNFADAAYSAARNIRQKMDQLKKYTTLTDDRKIAAFAMFGYNAGLAGSFQQVNPKDAEPFTRDVFTVIESDKYRIPIVDTFRERGRGLLFRSKIANAYLDIGWKANRPPNKNMDYDYNKYNQLSGHHNLGGTYTNAKIDMYNGTGTPKKSWEYANLKFYQGLSSYKNAGIGISKEGITPTDKEPGGKQIMGMHFEGMEYITGTYTFGRTAELEMQAFANSHGMGTETNSNYFTTP